MKDWYSTSDVGASVVSDTGSGIGADWGTVASGRSVGGSGSVMPGVSVSTGGRALEDGGRTLSVAAGFVAATATDGEGSGLEMATVTPETESTTTVAGGPI